eukprot:9647160-Alexandrium_andersonii.AAC.1
MNRCEPPVCFSLADRCGGMGGRARLVAALDPHHWPGWHGEGRIRLGCDLTCPKPGSPGTVSYTHLTLPTICSV